MDTQVKLRPDTHYAPVDQGVYWSRPGGRSFVLSGPPALFGLIDTQHHLLARGTSVDELVGVIGSDAARPVLDHIVRTLLAEDMLLDMDAGGTRPDPADADTYADVLAYLEAQCRRPYRAFATIRAAHVHVVGAGPAAENLVRGLAGSAVGAVTRGDAGTDADLTVLIDDVEHPIECEGAAGRVLLVTTGSEVANVGVVVDGPEQLRAMRGAVERFDAWARREDVGAAPRPLSAVYAGALAARTVIDALAGLDAAGNAAVVYGSALECRRLPLRLGEDEAWTETVVDADEVLDRTGEHVTGAAEELSEDRADVVDEAGTNLIHERASTLTARWIGAARWGEDLDLPQLPVALATVSPIGDPDTAFLGWGQNRAEAGVDALLAMLRAGAVGADDPTGAAAGAGTDSARFLCDGLLRLAGTELIAAPVAPIDVAEVGTWIIRSLYGIITEYFDRPLRLWVRQLPGLRWFLVTATAADGTVLAHEWGPSRQAATYAALTAVTVRCQLAEAATGPAIPDGIGTWAVRPATDAQVRQCLRELLDVHAATGHKVTAHLAGCDPVTGERPLHAGTVSVR
ncbi:MAG TPA: hypothetical protein VGF84_01285 [Micromonosporaceae bacterium]